MKFIIPPSLVKILSNKYISFILIIISLTTILTNLYKGNLYPLIIYFLALLILTSFNDNTNFNLLLSFIIMTIFTSNCLKEGEPEGFENNPGEDTAQEYENFKANTPELINEFNDTIQQDDADADADADADTEAYSDGNDHISEPMQINNKKINIFDKIKKKKNVINYASTIKDAYSNLNEIIGSDGIKNLTADTQNLMAEQMKLAESMKNIEPLINGFGPILDKAHGLLGSIDTKSFDNIKSLAKKFSI